MNTFLMIVAVILLVLSAFGIDLEVGSRAIHLGWLGLAIWAATSLTNKL